MSEAFSNSSIDTELQVRLMNLVMGEASDFERDQLQLLMEQRSELAAYYRHLEQLHGLLCEVAAGEPSLEVDASAADGAWQLSTERRERVLAVLDNQSPNPPDKVALANKSGLKRWRVTVAQVVVFASLACVLIGLMLPSVQMAREASKGFSAQFSGGTEDALFLSEIAPTTAPAAPVTAQTTTELSSALTLPPDLVASTGSPDVMYSLPNITAGVPSELEGRNLAEGMAAYQPSAGGSSAGGSSESTTRFAQPSNASAALLPPIPPPSTPASAAPPVDALAWSVGQPTGGMGGMLSGSGGEMGNGPPNGMGGVGGPSSFALGMADGNRDKSLNDDFESKPLSGPRLAIDNFSTQNQAGQADAVPAKPDSQWFGKGQQNSFEFAVELPQSEVAEWEGVDSNFDGASAEIAAAIPVPSRGYSNGGQASSVAVPNGGEILLGRIGKSNERKSGETEQNDHFDIKLNDELDGLSTLMETITPRIIIQEEEEQKLSELSLRDRQVPPADGEPQAAMQAGENGPPPTYPSDEVWKGLSLRRMERYGWAGADDQPQTDGPFAADSNAGSSAEKLEQLEQDAESLDKKSKSDRAKTSSGLSQAAKEVAEAARPEMLGESMSTAQGAKDNLPEIALLQNLPFTYDLRVRNAPSPELGSGVRAGIDTAGKPTAPQQPVTLDEQSASTEAFSTFSLHVSDVSFKLAQTALSQGQWPEEAKIRIEEFVNALDYHDPLPSGDQKVACRIEQAIHPFLMQRNLLRVSMRTAATGRSQNTPLRLTVLLDNSGSMERPDRRQAVLRAFQTLVQQLNAADQITLISFASTPRLLADKVPGSQGERLLQLIENLPSEGGTNIEAALLLAREKATEQQLAGAQNRIVLLTDGAVNLGNANPERLAKLITQMRDAGIAFDAAGISALNLNDEVLEALTRQGDGRYYLLDSAVAASESFASQIAGALRPSAQNVKVQVEFNPLRVGRYKLLGFEKHRLNKEDFRNDQVDAAELAAAEAGVAVYQFEIKPDGSGDVGSVSVRFRDLSTGQMVERRWPIPYEANAPRLEHAQPSMQLAASAALFAAKLGGGPLADSVDLATLQGLLAKLPEQVASQPRVQQLRAMIDQAIATHRVDNANIRR